MPQLYKCPQGHQWESADGVTTSFHCPTCGENHSSVVDLTPGSTLPGGDALPPPPQPIFPAIPGYEIVGQLGRGGMGVVYQARQMNLNRVVALKMILAGADAGPTEMARFRGEAESVARLQHPNIVQVFDVGAHEGRPYFTMEFMEGGGLNQKNSSRPPTPREAAALVETLARAMQHAHRRGVVHRDLKPANVLLTADGLPKIADFGLAKRLDVAGETAAGAVLGTAGYMAPEQAEGKSGAAGPAADVWALGAILYERLTGRPPFRADTLMHTLTQVLTKDPAPPRSLRADVPAELENICLKCLQKDPARRYTDAAALADDLSRFLAAPAPAAPAPKPRSRVPFWVGVVAAGLLLLAVVPFMIPWKGGALPTLPSTGPAAHGSPNAKPYWDALAVNGPADEVYQRIAFPTRTVGYVAGRSTVYKTTDGGKNWQSVRRIDSPQPGHQLHFLDNQTGWLASDKLWQTTNGGNEWQALPLPSTWQNVRGFVAASDGWMLAGGAPPDGSVALARRKNAGSSWEAGTIAKEDADRFRGWLLTDLTIIGPGAAMAAVGEPLDGEGAILMTTDAGASWKALPDVKETLFCIRANGPEKIWASGSAGLFLTGTGGGLKPVGETLQVPITRLAFDPNGSGFGLAPLWQGRVLITGDGEKWEKLEVPLGYSLPDAAVVDAGWAYVLGSDGKIARYINPLVQERE